MPLDLTRFGFTPTESLVYEVMLRSGPGTGYAIARAAGLARANAYAALEGLVQKGAARVEEGRPKRYRPEPPATLVARIVDRQGQALDELSSALDQVTVPASPTLVELSSTRGTLQLISHEVARAQRRVALLLPPDGYPPLIPSLRKAAGSGAALHLASTAPVELAFAPVELAHAPADWPGLPVLMAVDDRGAIIATWDGETVRGHWGTAPTLVAAADALIAGLRAGVRA